MQTIETRYAEWQKLIEEQKTSGLSKAGFCKMKGIRENSFYYSLDKLNRPKTKPLSSVENFIPVEIKSPISAVTQFSELRLILKNGIEYVLPEKALYYEPNCFTLVYKRLEQGKFIFPKNQLGHIEISQEHVWTQPVLQEII